MAISVVGTESDLNFKETELCLGLPGGGIKFEAAEATPKATGKRGFAETVDLNLHLQAKEEAHRVDVVNLNLHDNLNINASKDMNSHLPPPAIHDPAKPPAKAQVVGWPPVRTNRKNFMAQKNAGRGEGEKVSSGGGAFVKVSMDGAPYLRKVDLKLYTSYQQLSDALAMMFSSFTMGNYGANGMIDFMNESKLMDLLNSSEYVPTYEDKDGDWMLVGDVPWEMFVDSCKRLRIMKGSEAIGLAPRAMEKCKNRT